MKIKKAHVIFCKTPLKLSFKTSQVDSSHCESVFVVLENEEGLTGFGEGVAREHITGEKSIDTFNELVSFFEENIDFEIENSLTGIASNLAYECALYDIIGQESDKPIFKILNPDSSVEERSYVGFIGLSSEGEKLINRIKKLESKGYTTVRIKSGPDINREIERIKTIHENSSLKIWIDANQSWELIDPARLESVKHLICMLEQPVKQTNLNGLKKFKDFGFTVMADESLHNLKDLKQLIDEDLVDAANIKPMKFGSFTKVREAACLGKENGLELYAGGTICSDVFATYSRHIEFAIAKLDYFTTGLPRWKNLPEEIVVPQIEMEGNKIKKPSEPGLGVKLDLEKIKEYIVNEKIISL